MPCLGHLTGYADFAFSLLLPPLIVGYFAIDIKLSLSSVTSRFLLMRKLRIPRHRASRGKEKKEVKRKTGIIAKIAAASLERAAAPLVGAVTTPLPRVPALIYRNGIELNPVQDLMLCAYNFVGTGCSKPV